MLFSHEKREKVKDFSINAHINVKLAKLNILFLSLIYCLSSQEPDAKPLYA